jgi:hypothetical protein
MQCIGVWEGQFDEVPVATRDTPAGVDRDNWMILVYQSPKKSTSIWDLDVSYMSDKSFCLSKKCPEIQQLTCFYMY